MVALNQIGQIAITVRDLPRAVNFYRDVLGMRHLFDAGPKLSFFDCGGVRLMLELFDLTPDAPERAMPPAPPVHVLNQTERFTDALAHQGRLPDSARVERMAARVHLSTGPVRLAAALTGSPRRLVATVRAPGQGERWLSLPLG